MRPEMSADHRIDAGLAEVFISANDRAVAASITGELDVSNVATVQAAVVSAMRGGAPCADHRLHRGELHRQLDRRHGADVRRPR